MNGGGGAEPHARSCELPLPADFRVEDVLAFHRRDALRVAERVDGTTQRKGLVWAGLPACLTICFTAGWARAGLDIDGSPRSAPAESLESLARRMLGLDQPVAAFAAAFAAHPLLGPLIARRPGLRVPLTATPFEALTWAITGQQISVHAAVAVRGRLIRSAGIAHSSGLLCYPDELRIAAMSEPALRLAGLSGSKARSLLALSRSFLAQPLPMAVWRGGLDASLVEAIRARLLALPGVGPWTVDYALLRGFGWLDGSLHGDAAVRRTLRTLLGGAEKIDAARTRDWLAGFSPWRALVAAHLWAWGNATEDATDDATDNATDDATENQPE